MTDHLSQSGVSLIAAERARQVAEERWTVKVIVPLGRAELVDAAVCYALAYTEKSPPGKGDKRRIVDRVGRELPAPVRVVRLAAGRGVGSGHDAKVSLARHGGFISLSGRPKHRWRGVWATFCGRSIVPTGRAV